MEVEALIHEAAMVVQKYVPNGAQVVLFGSQAKGDADPTSDIDLGILYTEPISFENMTRIYQTIQALPTLRKIDVVDLQSVDPAFRAAALQHHKILISPHERTL